MAELSKTSTLNERPQVTFDPANGEILSLNAIASDFLNKPAADLVGQNVAIISAQSRQLDVLTQLPNRQLFLDRLQQALLESQRHQNAIAVLFIDLDRFKPINDSLGHQAGDQVLIEVAQRLKKNLRQEDTLARIGGDEFVVLLKDTVTLPVIERIANDLLAALTQPFYLPQGIAELGGSIGISIGPQDGQTAEALLQKADLAMYRAKNNGRQQWAFFSQALDQEARQKFHMEQKMRLALDNENLRLEFEPIIDTRDQSLFALEARISPFGLGVGQQDLQEMMATIEQSYLGVQLSEWRLLEVLRVLNTLEAVDSNLSIAVRVPAIHFRQKGFVDWLETAFQESQAVPENLFLQLDENCLNINVIDVPQSVAALNDLGVEVVLEQFGALGTSLFKVANLPFAAIKMTDLGLRDQATARGLRAQKKERLVSAILAFAHQLNKTLIATQIFTQDQLAFMQSQHCDLAQGPWFGEPLFEEDLASYILLNQAAHQDIYEDDEDHPDRTYEDYP